MGSPFDTAGPLDYVSAPLDLRPAVFGNAAYDCVSAPLETRSAALETTASPCPAESVMSSACSLPAASTRLSRNATEILTQMNNAIHVPLPSLLAIREQLLVAKQQAEGEKVVLQADVAESLHIALSGFARLRERTRELRGDVKEYMLKSEDRTRQLRSKNYKLLSQLEDERSARRSRTLSDRADARSALGAEAEGLRSANAELMRRAAALEDKLRQLGCDDMVDGDAGGTGGGSSEAGSTKGGSLEPVEARMNAFSRRIATIVDAEATTSDDLASQSAALDQEMQLLKRQLAEVEVHRARVDADLELKQAEEEKERRAANPLDTQSSMMSYLYSMLTPIKPAPKPLVGGEETLTMMLVDTKMQLAEAQDEVMRLKRELKRCAAENESCSHKIVELEDKLGKAVERAQAAEARAEDAEETTRVTRIALKLCQSGPEPNGDYKLRTGCSSTHPADIDTGIYLQQSLDIGADPGFAEACRRLSPASSVCGDGGDAAEEGGGGEAAPPSKHPHTHPNLCILDAPLAAMPLSKVHDQLLSVQSYATNSHESTTSTKDASGDATVPAEVSAYPARRNTACLGR